MKEFIKNMLSSESGVSSKRTIGAILILVFIGGTVFSLCVSKELTQSSMTLLTTTAYLGTGLLMGTLFEKLKQL